jgi:hypothetical protein
MEALTEVTSLVSKFELMEVKRSFLIDCKYAVNIIFFCPSRSVSIGSS